eukprot:gene6051-3287_t
MVSSSVDSDADVPDHLRHLDPPARARWQVYLSRPLEQDNDTDVLDDLLAQGIKPWDAAADYAAGVLGHACVPSQLPLHHRQTASGTHAVGQYDSDSDSSGHYLDYDAYLPMDDRSDPLANARYQHVQRIWRRHIDIERRGTINADQMRDALACW